VAGPDPQGGRPPGTVFVGVAVGERLLAVRGDLPGDRAAIRAATVELAVASLLRALEQPE
jgi:nicotinamide-nucleotide amidase